MKKRDLSQRDRMRRVRLRMNKKKVSNKNRNLAEGNDRFIYVIRHGQTMAYKIGCGNPSARLRQMQIGNPAKLSGCTFQQFGNYPEWAESLLHERYARYNIHYEWFLLPDEVLSCLIEDIEDLANVDLPKTDVPIILSDAELEAAKIAILNGSPQITATQQLTEKT